MKFLNWNSLNDYGIMVWAMRQEGKVKSRKGPQLKVGAQRVSQTSSLDIHDNDKPNLLLYLFMYVWTQTAPLERRFRCMSSLLILSNCIPSGHSYSIQRIGLVENIEEAQKNYMPLNQHLCSVPVFLASLRKGKIDNVWANNVRHKQGG